MTTLTALFDSRADADDAVVRLTALGIPDASIRVTGTEDISATEDKGFWASLGDLFMPDDDREAYAEGIRRGGYLLTITNVNRGLYDEALDILDDEGTVNLDERAETWRAEGWGGTVAASAAAGEETIIPIVEERLKVGKRDVTTGRTRVRSYVTETPVEEGVTLREQHVVVEQRSVDRPATEADLAATEKTVEAEDRAEEVVVGKEARVIGEVTVKTDQKQRDEVISETVKKTEVEVDEDNKP